MKELLVLFDEYLEKQDVLSKLTEAEKLHDLGYSEIHTIVAIQELEEANVTAIAEKMHMTKGAISKIINLAPSLETAWILGVTTASCMHLGHFIY